MSLLKKHITALWSLGVIVALSSSPAVAGYTPGTGKADPKSVVFVTGNPGGTYYFIGTGMAKVVQEVMERKATVEASSAISQQATSFADSSNRTFTVTSVDSTLEAVRGDKAAGYKAPLKKVRIIIGGHCTRVTMGTLEDSSVKSFADIRGKKVGAYIKGMANRAQFDAICDFYGIDSTKDLRVANLSQSEQVDAVKDGTLDVFNISGGIPTAALTDLSNSRKLRLLNVDKPVQEHMLKINPAWSFDTIPAGTYKDINEPVTVSQYQVVLLGNSDMADDFVYQFVKACCEHNKLLSGIHPEGAMWNADVNLALYKKYPDYPWHPGFVKYMEELIAAGK